MRSYASPTIQGFGQIGKILWLNGDVAVTRTVNIRDEIMRDGNNVRENMLQSSFPGMTLHAVFLTLRLFLIHYDR
jgi:hypothetical protein